MTTNINKTETFVTETWINCKGNVVRIYKGSDGNYYYKYIGRGMPEMRPMDADFATSLVWLENNRTRRAA